MNRAEEEQRPGPIEELRNLEEEPTPGFFDRVQRSVGRRHLASHAVDLSWTAMQVVTLEALELIFEALASRQDEEGGNG